LNSEHAYERRGCESSPSFLSLNQEIQLFLQVFTP
jgi:hypothetical protein